MNKPLLLDTFCSAGGCTRGYQMAGFKVVGNDINPQKHYIGDDFILGDALILLSELLEGKEVGKRGYRLREFDVIHASPPCQGYSRLRHLPWLKGKKWPLLIEPCRTLLQATGKHFIIENVEDAPLDGIILCGQMFGLPLYRHRKFELNLFMLCPSHPKHTVVIGHGRLVNDRRKGTLNNSSAKGAWGKQTIVTVAGGQYKKADGEKAMRIDWMTKDELSEAIPPAYCEWIGKQLVARIFPC